jgi:hypothetical protein
MARYLTNSDPALYATQNPSLVQAEPTFWNPAPLSQPSQAVTSPPPEGPVVSEVQPGVWGAMKFNEFVPNNFGYLRKALVVGGASYNPYISVAPPIPGEGKYLTMPANMWAGSTSCDKFTENRYQ